MNMFHSRRKRVLAAVLAVMVLLGSAAAGLSMTYAASTYRERLTQPNSYDTVEVGRSKTIEGLSGVNAVRSSDVLRLSAAKSGGSAVVEGVSAGVVGISVATKLYSANLPYQVTDSSHISGYDLSSNGEINKKLSDAAFDISSIVTTYVTSWSQLSVKDDEDTYQKKPEAKSQITWSSRNANVADFNAAGLLVPKAKGVATILGSFDDRWGVPRSIVILVGVDTVVGNSLLGDLADAIKKGEAILGLNPNPYEDAGLGSLQSAVNNGKTLLSSEDPGDGEISAAITGIETAIAGLSAKANGGGGEDPIDIPNTPDGPKKVRPVPGPEHIYEVLDGQGNSKVPPEYLYDPDGSFEETPPRWSGDELPAYKDGYVYYAEEAPEKSNIFTPIKEDGSRDYDNAIWGGGDKRPGGGDDCKAAKEGALWYTEHPAGSNLWKPNVTSGANAGTLSPNGWKGGGGDGLPSGNDNLFPIIYHDGAYYAGPFNDGSDTYYIGSGANGRFDTSGNSYGIPVGHQAAGDDKKLYWTGTGTPGDGGTGGFDVTPPAGLGVSTISLPNAQIGVPYSQSLTATGSGTLSWSLSGGSLPTGLSLAADGVIAGTCYAEGTYSFTVKVSNGSKSAEKLLSIKVEAGIPGLDEGTYPGTILTIDGVKWVKVKDASLGYSKFALLVRYENFGTSPWCTPEAPSTNYRNSTLRKAMTEFYKNEIKVNQPTLWAAMVLPEDGLGGEERYAAFSSPSINMAMESPQLEDACFALSHKEYYDWLWPANGARWWTRSFDGIGGAMVYYTSQITERGGCDSVVSNSSSGLRPAVWVMVSK